MYVHLNLCSDVSVYMSVCSSLYLENNIWFAAVLLCMYWRIIHLYHILSRVWSPLAKLEFQYTCMSTMPIDHRNTHFCHCTELDKQEYGIVLSYGMYRYVGGEYNYVACHTPLNIILLQAIHIIRYYVILHLDSRRPLLGANFKLHFRIVMALYFRHDNAL